MKSCCYIWNFNPLLNGGNKKHNNLWWCSWFRLPREKRYFELFDYLGKVFRLKVSTVSTNWSRIFFHYEHPQRNKLTGTVPAWLIRKTFMSGTIYGLTSIKGMTESNYFTLSYPHRRANVCFHIEKKSSMPVSLNRQRCWSFYEWFLWVFWYFGHLFKRRGCESSCVQLYRNIKEMILSDEHNWKRHSSLSWYMSTKYQAIF